MTSARTDYAGHRMDLRESRIRKLLRLLEDETPGRLLDVGCAGTGHLRYYTPRMLRQQLARHGLRVERHLGNWVPLVPQRLLDDRRAPWLAVTGDWWPSLAMGILMKARREAGARSPQGGHP